MAHSERWGKFISGILAERHLSTREASRVLGIHYTQIGDMRRGWIPPREKVEIIARTLQLPRRQVLEAAGYLVVEPGKVQAIVSRMADIVKEIQKLQAEVRELQEKDTKEESV